jgi:hypothetical protein
MKAATLKTVHPGARPRGSWFRITASSAVSALKAFRKTRMGWLLPLMVVLFAFALILAVLGSVGPLAPFVYPLL